MVDLDRIIRLAIKSKKIFFGSKLAFNLARSGRASLIILASNIPDRLRREITYSSELSGIPLFTYNGTNLDLSLVCGKRFPVSALTIRGTIDPQLRRMLKIQTSEME
jgi:ribosomal protein L30E